VTYLSYDDIAKLTRIPVATLRVWRHRGKMPEPDYMPSGRIPLWTEKTIQGWWKEHDGSSTQT
jgi:hypothetical protein